jgi:L-alanine-DL-glutamate epimerase-like enolase superfamily enzyme
VSLYDAVRGLELTIEDFGTERRETMVSTEFKRVTTTIVLRGLDRVGEGEDVTYDAAAHDGFPELRERGRMTLEELSQRLEAYELEDYRRWAFESAALDLALRQNDASLGDVLGLEYRPVRFVVSTRLEIRPWLDLYPQLEFKLDPTSEWSDEHMREIAATGAVRVLDLKGQYHGTPVDQPPDARLYRAVVETFPEAIIEDPALTDETRAALRGADGRISWDAPIHSAEDIAARDPRHVNIKPSRFGTVRRLFDAIDHCHAHGIAMYGGGQFELGVGRAHIQTLASLFYADAPNDVAPGAYNEGTARPSLPQSPLSVAVEAGL